MIVCSNSTCTTDQEGRNYDVEKHWIIPLIRITLHFIQLIQSTLDYILTNAPYIRSETHSECETTGLSLNTSSRPTSLTDVLQWGRGGIGNTVYKHVKVK